MTITESEMKQVPGPVIDEATLDRLMAQIDAGGLELLGPDGVLTELTSRIMNRAMQTELTDHLGYEAGDPAGRGSGNNRNGTSGRARFGGPVAMRLGVGGCWSRLGGTRLA